MTRDTHAHQNLIVSNSGTTPFSSPEPSFPLVMWSAKRELWSQPLPDVRNFLTSGGASEVVSNTTARDVNPEGGRRAWEVQSHSQAGGEGVIWYFDGNRLF